MGQYNTAWADGLLFPDISDAGFDPGLMNTANIRQEQIRYTYLAGSGITLSASLEQNEGGFLYLQNSTTAPTKAVPYAGSISSFVTDNTDAGGINSLPSLNAGIAWDQPWGHLMARVGVAQDQVRNSEVQNIFSTSVGGTHPPGNHLSKWGEAVEAGGYLNTWGQDQWKFLINYSNGVANFSTDLSATSGGEAFCNGYTGTCDLISDTALYTMYVHRFNPNWRWTADAGVGMFSKPGAASRPDQCGARSHERPVGELGEAALDRAYRIIWSPVPGLTDIYLEWDHWNREVQASGTSGEGSKVDVSLHLLLVDRANRADRFDPPAARLAGFLCAAIASAAARRPSARPASRAGRERAAVAGMDDPAAIEHDRPLGEFERDARMLLDQEERQLVFALQAVEALQDGIDDHRRQALERLVHQQQARIAHQRPGDAQHLLLAAGQRVAAIPPALGERGKEIVNPRQGPAPGPGRDQEIFLDRQRAENLALLRHEADARARARR